jgi:hypothetical protein
MDIDRRYEWQYVVVGAAGLATTAAVTGPGEHSVSVGPVGFDPFYLFIGCFGFVSCLSVAALWQSRREE